MQTRLPRRLPGRLLDDRYLPADKVNGDCECTDPLCRVNRLFRRLSRTMETLEFSYGLDIRMSKGCCQAQIAKACWRDNKIWLPGCRRKKISELITNPEHPEFLFS